MSYELVDVIGKVKPGMAYYDLYATYYAIMRRCYNKAYIQFKDYGGRGITVHNEWIGRPYQFILWVLNNLGPRPDGLTLDRRDNNGNYEPGNLRWASKHEQQLNRRLPNLRQVSA